MNSQAVQKEIDQSRRLGVQLEEIVVSKNQFPVGDRNVLLIAYWALMFDYHKGILSLLQSEFCGAHSRSSGPSWKLLCARTSPSKARRRT